MDNIQRRISAAKFLGGFDSWKDMAEAVTALGQEGLGETTIRGIRDADVPGRRGDLAQIAHACGVHPRFFTAPLLELGQPAGEPAAATGADEDATAQLLRAVRDLQERVAGLEADVMFLATQSRPPSAATADPTQGPPQQETQ